MNTGLLSLVALLPAIVGPLPSEERVLEAELCNGGTITIALEPGEDSPEDQCRLDACHVGNCRKKLI